MVIAAPLPADASPAGLTSEEARRRLVQHGPNEVVHGSRRPALRILRGQPGSPLVLVVLGVALVSRLLGERVEATVILQV